MYSDMDRDRIKLTNINKFYTLDYRELNKYKSVT